MVFFERCVKSVSLIGDSVDRTAETQGRKILSNPFFSITMEMQQHTGAFPRRMRKGVKNVILLQKNSGTGHGTGISFIIKRLRQFKPRENSGA